MTEEMYRILENHEKILLGISAIITPMVAEDLRKASINNDLIDCYHETRKILNKDYIESRTRRAKQSAVDSYFYGR